VIWLWIELKESSGCEPLCFLFEIWIYVNSCVRSCGGNCSGGSFVCVNVVREKGRPGRVRRGFDLFWSGCVILNTWLFYFWFFVCHFLGLFFVGCMFLMSSSVLFSWMLFFDWWYYFLLVCFLIFFLLIGGCWNNMRVRFVFSFSVF